jgi:hypothetical protein
MLNIRDTKVVSCTPPMLFFHSVGVKGAKASGAKAVAVPSLQNQRNHYYIADVILYSLLDFQPEMWGLPPFEDRNNSLHCPLILFSFIELSLFQI